MNKLSFKILPSPESNDHEIRILIDEKDILGEDYLGLDPPAFLKQTNFDQNGELMVGRCSCGCEGCRDFLVSVQVQDNIIQWTNNKGLKLKFDNEKYLYAINSARIDFTWEDINRKVERLTTNILKNSETKGGYRFDWASARIKLQNITLSYSKNGKQKLFEISWDGQTETNIETKAKQFLNNELK